MRPLGARRRRFVGKLRCAMPAAAAAEWSLRRAEFIDVYLLWRKCNRHSARGNQKGPLFLAGESLRPEAAFYLNRRLTESLSWPPIKMNASVGGGGDGSAAWRRAREAQRLLAGPPTATISRRERAHRAGRKIVQSRPTTREGGKKAAFARRADIER